MKKELILSLGLAFASSSALAADWGFDTWDADADGYIGEEEFETGFTEGGLFNQVDADDSGYLEEDEWADWGVGADVGAWNADEDAGLADDEFATGLFQEWDEDEDAMLSEEEWGLAEEEGWFNG